MEGRAAQPSGVWEVVGVVAAVVPCGILAGLYFATSDPVFLSACAVFAAAAAGIVYFRRPRRLSWVRGRRRSEAARETGQRQKARGGLHAVNTSLRRIFTLRVLKLAGLAIWLLAWGGLAVLYARVAENANLAGLGMLVLIGGFSPVLIYFGLEGGVSRLSRRLRSDE